MIRYEIKKLLKSWLLLAVFAVMLGIFLKYYYNKNINNHCLEAYDGVGITVTAEAYDELKMAVDRAAVMGSNNLFVEAFNAQHPAYIWPIVYKSATDWLQTEEKNQAVIRKAEANIAMYTERGDGYQAAYNELVKKIYEGRRTPYFMDSSGWLAYFSTTENSPLFSMWGLLAVLVSVVGSVSLFTMGKKPTAPGLSSTRPAGDGHRCTGRKLG